MSSGFLSCKNRIWKTLNLFPRDLSHHKTQTNNYSVGVVNKLAKMCYFVPYYFSAIRDGISNNSDDLYKVDISSFREQIIEL